MKRFSEQYGYEVHYCDFCKTLYANRIFTSGEMKDKMVCNECFAVMKDQGLAV